MTRRSLITGGRAKANPLMNFGFWPSRQIVHCSVCGCDPVHASLVGGDRRNGRGSLAKHRHPPRLVARQPIGRRAVRRSDTSGIGGRSGSARLTPEATLMTPLQKSRQRIRHRLVQRKTAEYSSSLEPRLAQPSSIASGSSIRARIHLRSTWELLCELPQQRL